MFRGLSRKRRFGFTLVEVLVTTVVIGVLAAVVLPALAKQTSAADPARVASDLNNIKKGIEVFSNNLRPDFPGDLEDLVNDPTDASSVSPNNTSAARDDLALDGGYYANRTFWNGPYVSQSLAEGKSLTGNTTWRVGATGFFDNQIHRCDISAASACAVGGDNPFVTLQLNGMSQNEAETVETLLDGTTTNSATTGLFRAITSGTAAVGYFFALPYTQ